MGQAQNFGPLFSGPWPQSISILFSLFILVWSHQSVGPNCQSKTFIFYFISQVFPLARFIFQHLTINHKTENTWNWRILLIRAIIESITIFLQITYIQERHKTATESSPEFKPTTKPYHTANNIHHETNRYIRPDSAKLGFKPAGHPHAAASSGLLHSTNARATCQLHHAAYPLASCPSSWHAYQT